jgi:hypothetical protein
MKRLLVAVALSILSLAAFGQSMDRDVLLTTDGTLYTVDSYFTTAEDTQIQSTRYLTLTTQKDGQSKSETIPATLIGGSHVEPALAYDGDSKTLFVFWENARVLSSDLLFTTYQNGVWGKVTSLDPVDWDLRRGLRIALTRKTQDTAKDGSKILVPEITVHAVWWEQGRETEWARYAMITLDHGDAAQITVQNLSKFLSHVDPVLDTPVDREILRHPAVFESPTHDTVDVVFGDTRSDKMHRVTLQPVAEGGRIRIPVGKDRTVPTPTATITSVPTTVGAISTNGDNIAYYFATENSVKYLLYANGAWSDLRTMSLSDRLTSDAAVNALRRMLSSE